MRENIGVSTESTFPATSFLQSPFMKEGQDPIMDDNGVIKSTSPQICRLLESSSRIIVPTIMIKGSKPKVLRKSTRLNLHGDVSKCEEEYQQKYGAYEIERKEINRLRIAQQDKICNIVFFFCVILVGFLIIVYAYVYLDLIHKIKFV